MNLQTLVQIAEQEVGVREQGGNNRGSRIQVYQGATDLDPGAWPWCAAFVCYVIQEWLKDPASRSFLNLATTTPEVWRPKTALAWGFLAWARTHPATTQILTERDRAMPGDIVVFDFSHVGIVVADNGFTINTIEGNTNGRGDRDSTSGDGVWRKTRAKTLARAFIRIRPSVAPKGKKS